MQETILKVEHITKEYRLGQIGRTTLREELQRMNAKLLHKEDPTRKIYDRIQGSTNRFLALNDVSFSVKKGERVGIIGHNGAGKSTLLKLISRITAPTGGDIWLNGRVASMLEVGTGFSGELTGRENIYMNGAILGMKKKEIDAKIEDIIEFSECRQFIDTPVKRYSSGMYVKLAFSVAAHLDAEIMIMDEVLAVGDMAFQKKCIDKMGDVSRKAGRTILYVSHNMNTIRQLCDRCIVLSHGKIIFDGDVESGIAGYMGVQEDVECPVSYDFSAVPRKRHFGREVLIRSIRFTGTKSAKYSEGCVISFDVDIFSRIDRDDVRLVLMIRDGNNVRKIATCRSEEFSIKAGESRTYSFLFDSRGLMPDDYTFDLEIIQYNAGGSYYSYDSPSAMMPVKITRCEGNPEWAVKNWGSIQLKEMSVKLWKEKALVQG